jgi:D-isomer specific 2-hydroxyacid dehydrogenase, NAD binding domain
MSQLSPETALTPAPKPILNVRHELGARLTDTALVALQHLLPSVGPLFQRFVGAGFRPEQMFVLGKPYSTVPQVAETIAQTGCHVHVPPPGFFDLGHYSEKFHALVVDFWATVRKKLPGTVRHVVILDEGGWLCRDTPDAIIDGLRVTAVEHTMFGLITAPAGGRPYPVVLMAASAAKTRFEGAVIADAIIERLEECIVDLPNLGVGILGLGNIGEAVARAMQGRRHGLLSGYDIIPEKGEELRELLTSVRSRSELVANCDVILGCTGTDSFEPGAQLHQTKKRRWLASCSSGDIEFSRVAYLLANRVTALRSDPFRDARGMIGDAEVILLNGGFPLNFDRVREREHPTRIQLTRELTFASVLQAALCLEEDSANAGVMLDPEVQRQLIEAWLLGPDAGSRFPYWAPHAVNWWAKNSRGVRVGSSLTQHLEVAATS